MMRLADICKKAALALFLLCLPVSLHAQTQNIYIAQTAAGGNTGADCADALVYTFFNTSGNWASSFTAGKISPGTTVHLCGTITGTNTANTNILTTQGSGLSGSPITVHWETGAIVQSPACPGGSGGSNACVLASNNYITIDGGTNGKVQAMLNGDSGATNCLSGTCTIQQANTIGVAITGNNDIVENLTVTHMCMHTFQNNDAGFYQGNCNGIVATGNPALVTNNAVDNASTGMGGGNSNQEYSYNTLTFCNRALVLGIGGAAVDTGIKIHNNDISQLYTWDDGAGNNYHHDGIMLEATATGAQFSGTQIYDNYLHGLWSNDNIYGASHITSQIFLDANGVANSMVNSYLVRNVLELDGPLSTYPFNAETNSTGVGGCLVAFPSGCSPANQSLIANNTFIKPGGYCWGIGDKSGAPFSFNNLCVTTAGGNLINSTNTYPNTSIDYNMYAGTLGANAFYAGGGIVNTFAQWQGGSLLLDLHGSNPTLASVALTSSYGLGTGSVAIGAAVNLTSAWCGTIPALCQGAPSSFGRGSINNGVALPSGTTAWDTGAYPSGSGPSGLVLSPGNLTISVN
jgi:hypothetical protein